MKNDEYYMKKALKQAEKAFLLNEVPVGAILVQNGRILASAYNKKDCCNNVLKHAELICIEKASKKLQNWRLNDCILYVTLEPCPMCASAIQQARISCVCYGAKSKNLQNSLIVDKIFSEKGANSIVEVRSGVLEDSCGKIISDFFKKKRD